MQTRRHAHVFKILLIVLGIGIAMFGAGKWLVANKKLAQANLSPVSLPGTTDDLKKMSEGVTTQIPGAANTIKNDLIKKALPVWNQMSIQAKKTWLEKIQPSAKKAKEYAKTLLQAEMGDRLKEFQTKYSAESKKLKDSLRAKFSRVLQNIFSPIK